MKKRHQISSTTHPHPISGPPLLVERTSFPRGQNFYLLSPQMLRWHRAPQGQMPEVERAGAPTEIPTFEQVVEQALAEQERQQGQHTFDGGAALLGNSAPCAATGVNIDSAHATIWSQPNDAGPNAAFKVRRLVASATLPSPPSVAPSPPFSGRRVRRNSLRQDMLGSGQMAQRLGEGMAPRTCRWPMRWPLETGQRQWRVGLAKAGRPT